MYSSFRNAIFLVLCLLGQGVHAQTRTDSGPSLPPPLPESVLAATIDYPMHLLGYGHMRKYLMDVFDASLWISGTQFSFDAPFVLELRYSRKLKGQDIVNSAMAQWKHLGLSDEQKLQDWRRQMSVMIPDVRTGDQLLGIYFPKEGTRFFRNGQPIGEISDPEFGPAFFAIWLDKKTSQPALRTALLGQECTKPTMTASAEATPCADATISIPQTPEADESKS